MLNCNATIRGVYSKLAVRGGDLADVGMAGLTRALARGNPLPDLLPRAICTPAAWARYRAGVTLIPIDIATRVNSYLGGGIDVVLEQARITMVHGTTAKRRAVAASIVESRDRQRRVI